MSKYQMRIKFDRKSRTYHFGEQITGNIELDSGANRNCSNISIKYGWRTHGLGSPDKGAQKNISLVGEPLELSAGEHRVIHFIITAPNGPVSYHGVGLNIDWYLSAHADIPLAGSIQCEEDFILLASASPVFYIVGNQPRSEIPPPVHQVCSQPISAHFPDTVFSPPTSDQDSSLLGIRLVITSIIGLWLFTALISIGIPWHDALLFTLFAGGILFFIILFAVIFYIQWIIRFSYKVITKVIFAQMMNMSKVRLNPSIIYTGESVACCLQFKTRCSIFLENIAAMLSPEEAATIHLTQGAKTTLKIFNMHTFIQHYYKNLQPGEEIYFVCILHIPPDAPATFQAENNNINWSVKLKVTFKRWHSWEKKIPITVLPGYIP